MRHLSIITLLILFISTACKKDKVEETFSFGSQESIPMEVNVLNKSIQAICVTDDYASLSTDLDINDDNEADLKFYSQIDSIPNPEGDVRWVLSFKILNENLIIEEVENSHIVYEHLSAPSYDYYGAYPRETRTLSYSCLEEFGAYETNSLAYPQPYINGSKFNYESINWTNRLNELYLIKSGYIEEQTNFNMAGDSIITVVVNENPSCFQMPVGNPFYLAFKLNAGSSYKIGWLKMKIPTFLNELEIKEVAISKESF